MHDKLATTVLLALGCLASAKHMVRNDRHPDTQVVSGPRLDATRYQLHDGLYFDIPGQHSNGSLLSIHLDPQLARKKGSVRDTNMGGIQRILPLFILPFIIQAAIVPVFLSALKFMLMKSLIIGKVALALIAANAFRNTNVFKSRNDERLADEHYGYHGHGMEEFGAYVNKRSTGAR